MDLYQDTTDRNIDTTPREQTSIIMKEKEVLIKELNNQILESKEALKREISEKLGVTRELRENYAKQEIYEKALPIIETIRALEESKNECLTDPCNIEDIKRKLVVEKKKLVVVEQQLETLVIKKPSETVKEQLNKLENFVKNNQSKLENNQEVIDITIDKFTEKINIKNLKSDESNIRLTINNLKTTLSALMMRSKLEKEISQLKKRLSQVVPFPIDDNNFQIPKISIIEEGKLKAERVAFGVTEKEFVKLNHAVEDLKKTSRKNKVFLLGNTGSCKSSLVNVLSHREIAEVGHTKPKTSVTNVYKVPEVNAEFVDSRGLHEGASLETNSLKSAEVQILEDLKKHNPDVIIYTVTPSDWRKFGNSLASPLKEIQQQFVEIPIILLLTKADDGVDVEDDKFKEIAKNSLDQIKKGLNDQGINFHASIFCTTKAITKNKKWMIKEPSYGIDELIGVINGLSSMDAQIVENPAESLVSNLKRGVGRKIIFTFAGISLGLSPIPFIDASLQLLLRLALVKFLSNLFGTNEKNFTTFRKDKPVLFVTTVIADVLLTATAVTLDFIGLVTFGVGYAISTCTSAVVQPPFTFAIGIEAYHYFTGTYLFGTSMQDKLMSAFK